MKTCLLALTLSLFVPAASRAQDVAATFSRTTERHHTGETPGRRRLPLTANPVELATTSLPTEGAYELPYGQATAQLNGVTIQVQTLPASSTVLVTFSMPSQQNLGVLELVNARTGQVVYTGSLLVSQGQLELPVADTAQPFEVRLSTDHDMIIARMAY
ncbi:MAG: hypothetical protein H7330_06990 [Hymenobacteraceae bacterium]|nr:hypothetical protein [Hymenobacteraceae bacterium]